MACQSFDAGQETVDSASAEQNPAQIPDPGSETGRTRRARNGADESVSLREMRRSERLSLGREQILDAAERLFSSQGYHLTSIEQIAKASEFSAGAIYNFFESKQDILLAVLARRGPLELARMRGCLDLDLPGDEMLVSIVMSIIDFHHQFPDFGRLSTRLSATGLNSMPGLARLYANGMRQAFDVYAAAIARGQQDGTIRAGDARSLGQLASRMVSAHHAMDPALSGTEPGLSTGEILEILRNAFAPGRR
jgi:AcrR family transcriptional regulator